MSTNRSKDRSGLCAFIFADGRRCRTPRRSGYLHLCAFHAQKEAQSRVAAQTGEDVSYFLSGTYLSACDLTSALGHLFSAVAQGQVKPKTATALAYLGRSSIILSSSPSTNTSTPSAQSTGVAKCALPSKLTTTVMCQPPNRIPPQPRNQLRNYHRLLSTHSLTPLRNRSGGRSLSRPGREPGLWRLPVLRPLRCPANDALVNPFRMNTCRSVAKQMTLTSFRINTYENIPVGRVLWLT